MSEHLVLTVNDLVGSGFITKIGLVKKPVGRMAARYKYIKYKNLISTFDIETTALEDIKHSVMYLWQWHFEGLGTVIGRTWKEFQQCVNWVVNQLSSCEKIVVYVHWLTHEFQYLKGIYKFNNEDIFAIDKRKVAKCTMCNAIEFRCSYLLSNQGLDSFLHDVGVKHEKIKGYDYKKRRFSYTALSDEELMYGIHDVLGLCEAVKKIMQRENDTLYTIPMTSTGYIRRELKRAMHDFSRNNRGIYHITPELLQTAMNAFRGGDTHASRFYSGILIEGVNIYMDDESSAYPFQIGTAIYPMSPWIEMPKMDMNKVHDMMERKRAILMEVEFYDIKLKDDMEPDPYIPKAKCIRYDEGKETIVDNGRIIQCKYVKLAITDIDLRIINDIYRYDKSKTNITKCWCSHYGALPPELIEVFIKHYVIKTSKKNVDGQQDMYDSAKRKFNAGFGNMVQNPLNEKHEYIQSERKFRRDDMSLKEACDKYNRESYLSYFWGVWTTAHQRMMLHNALMKVGKKYAIYWDTDGITHCNPNLDIFKDINEASQLRSKICGMVAMDKKGIWHYGGVFERKERKILKFKTYGAKKYVTEYEDGLEITISGVAKEDGSKELASIGGINRWNENTVFKDSGSTNFYYNDNVSFEYINEDGKKIYITDNVYSEASEFSMNIKPEYADVLKNARAIAKIYRQMNRHLIT